MECTISMPNYHLYSQKGNSRQPMTCLSKAWLQTTVIRKGHLYCMDNFDDRIINYFEIDIILL